MDLQNEAGGAADRLLGVLKRRGPATAGELATTLAITPEAARQQLVRLEAEGLVAPARRNGGVGRPARLWSLTLSAQARFPDAHAELTVRLIEAVRTELGEEALSRIISARERAARGAYAGELAGAKSLEEKVARLAAAREREGYMAEWRTQEGGFLLIENHCPICAAAAACQGFCRAELEIFCEALGPDAAIARVDHILAGARRCAYRITPVQRS